MNRTTNNINIKIIYSHTLSTFTITLWGSKWFPFQFLTFSQHSFDYAFTISSSFRYIREKELRGKITRNTCLHCNHVITCKYVNHVHSNDIIVPGLFPATSEHELTIVKAILLCKKAV